MDLFSNHYNFLLKRSFSINFDVLRSWYHVLFIFRVSNFADVDLLVRFRKGSSAALASRDIWDWLRIPSEHHDIWFSVRLTIWILDLATIIMHQLVKLFPQVNSTLEPNLYSYRERSLSWEDSTCRLWEPVDAQTIPSGWDRRINSVSQSVLWQRRVQHEHTEHVDRET